MTAQPRIILASTSPRRKALLEGVGLRLEVIAPDIDETLTRGVTVEASARAIAERKGRWVVDQLDEMQRADAIVIAADTMVIMDEHVLGKPRDEEHAKVMLYSLSGRSHNVITGVYLARLREGVVSEEQHITAMTEVSMKSLSEAEVEAYVASGEPMDKAGAYGIQGGANYMIQSIHGSYTNVVGLPLAEVVDTLVAGFGYAIR